jgi:SAM-dependent methyltransferase
LECPRCHSELESDNDRLYCRSEHSYPIVNGVPVFILPEKEQTIDIALASHDAAANGKGGPLYLKTIGVSEIERGGIKRRWAQSGEIDRVDPAISYLVGATSGLGYRKLVGQLKSYPIPKIPVQPGAGKLLLDIGCSWGRWSISAARRGWYVVGIDPSLGAIMAARRAFRSERQVMFVCGDARFLPFKSNTFDCVFSYSVIQHLSEDDAEITLAEIGRTLSDDGLSMVQMAHRGGLRSTYIRTRPDYADQGIFRVRYWSLDKLKNTFDRNIGLSIMVPEAFGGLGLLADDWRIVSGKAKILIMTSLILKNAARSFKPLIRIADSVYIISTKAPTPP